MVEPDPEARLHGVPSLPAAPVLPKHLSAPDSKVMSPLGVTGVKGGGGRCTP